MPPNATRPARASGRRGAAQRGAPDATPALPPWKAFVVMLTRETTAESGTFAGRVEHLGSGRREHFTSADELLAAMIRMLEDAEQSACNP